MVIKDFILDILFPRFCLGCGREGKYICDNCKIFISEVNPLNQFPQSSLDGLTCLWEYEGLIKNIIQTIKYQGLTDAIKELVGLARIEIQKGVFISYVPMFLRKEKKRGFNQAEIIAREIGKITNCKVVCLLKKIKETKDQTELIRKERLKNVKNSFDISCNVQGIENVILVDDVYTTGATMQECCKVLKQAGIKKVWGFTLARTS